MEKLSMGLDFPASPMLSCIHKDRERTGKMAKTPASQTLARFDNGYLTDKELQAAFLAARERGYLLSDGVLTAIIQAIVKAGKE